MDCDDWVSQFPCPPLELGEGIQNAHTESLRLWRERLGSPREKRGAVMRKKRNSPGGIPNGAPDT